MSADTGGIYLDDTTILHLPMGYNDPMFFAGYDANGSLLQYLALKSGGDDDSRVATDGAQNIYMCGDDGAVTLYFGNDSVHAQGGETMFLAKYKPNICNPLYSVSEELPLDKLIIFPNPATSTLTIQYTGVTKSTNVSIYDMMGRIMGNYPLTGSTTNISVQYLPPGLYQCRISDGAGNMETKKLIIMR
jgi:hypothetical protein